MKAGIKKTSPTCEKDFKDVISFLKTKHILPGASNAFELTSAKHLHSATFSLILWRFLLRDLPQCGQVFIEEIASDALQILPQALSGYRKSTFLLIRGVVENCLRHIYFRHHPIEFERMNQDKKWYPSVEDLFEYLFKHPAFTKIEPKFDAINKLKQLYGDLSAEVHGRKVEHLEMRRSLQELRFEPSTFRKQLTFMNRTTASINFLLLIFHEKQARSFPDEFKHFLLRSLPKQGRRCWHGIA